MVIIVKTKSVKDLLLELLLPQEMMREENAEGIAGTEEEFAILMTTKLKN